MPPRPSILGLVLALVILSCGGSKPTQDKQLPVGCSGATPSFSRDVVPIFAACSGEACHGAQFQSAGGLVNAASYREEPCQPGVLVAPGDLEHSYVIHKLTGVGLCPGTQVMPIGERLAPRQVQVIADWICSGAPDD
jgi:hypothetical protein